MNSGCSWAATTGSSSTKGPSSRPRFRKIGRQLNSRTSKSKPLNDSSSCWNLNTNGVLQNDKLKLEERTEGSASASNFKASEQELFVFGRHYGEHSNVNENTEKTSNVSNQEVESQLRNEFNAKLEIENKGFSHSDGTKRFEFNSRRMGSIDFVESYMKSLPKQIESLKLNDLLGSKKSSMCCSSDEREKLLSNEMDRKLNIGNWNLEKAPFVDLKTPNLDGNKTTNQNVEFNVKFNASTIRSTRKFKRATKSLVLESRVKALPEGIKNLTIEDSNAIDATDNQFADVATFVFKSKENSSGYNVEERDNARVPTRKVGNNSSYDHVLLCNLKAENSGSRLDPKFPQVDNAEKTGVFGFVANHAASNQNVEINMKFNAPMIQRKARKFKAASKSFIAENSEKALPERIKNMSIKDSDITDTLGYVEKESSREVPSCHPEADVNGSVKESAAFSDTVFLSAMSEKEIVTNLEENHLLSSNKMKFSAKASKIPRNKGKGKHHRKIHGLFGQDISQATPMDISPCQETLVDSHCSKEASVASEPFFSCNQYPSPQMNKNGSSEGAAVISNEAISGDATESFRTALEERNDLGTDHEALSTGNDARSSTNLEARDLDDRMTQHAVQHDVQRCSRDNGFAFSASSANESSNCSRKKILSKSKSKSRHSSRSCSTNSEVLYASCLNNFTPFTGVSNPQCPAKGNSHPIPTPCVIGDNSQILREQNLTRDREATLASAAAQEKCEMWRLRGNKAYGNGDWANAEDFYTRGISSVFEGETSRSCLRALMLCYSNRAATYMSTGRVRDALEDCKMASSIDPKFFRVHVRAANCHLILGEVEAASKSFQKCLLQFGSNICTDRKIVAEASDGFQQAQKVSMFMQQAAGILQKKTPENTINALEVLCKALSISPHSETLLQMKAESFFRLHKYEEVIKLCEETLDSAKKNFSMSQTSVCQYRLWRCRMISNSYFHLGMLEEALTVLDKEEELISVSDRSQRKEQSSLVNLAATIRNLVHHRATGNEAFQAGRYAEAVEHYSAALTCNVESRPFIAICFCNRAAAHSAMGQITEAIADCSLAIALNGNYLKAISRRATLYETIRDYGQATKDLQRLLNMLAKQGKNVQFGMSDKSTNFPYDTRETHSRISAAEEASQKGIPFDMYHILGIRNSASVSEIKKAYRKAALRHHPDKACQPLARSGNGDDGLQAQMEEVREEAERLFKMIGEAYAVLSDPDKRAQYDHEEEEMRMMKKRNGTIDTYEIHAAHYYAFRRKQS